jgi:glutathione synthase/RimK-type ligase-like ATP-grasp enzyme
MTTAVLVTCTTWPDLSESDRCYAEALAAHGITVTDAPWNGPFEPFAGADVVVLRSNWDYHHQLDDFSSWLDRVTATGAQLFNPAELVRWNLDKRYLLDLAARGAATPITHIVPPDAEAVSRVLDERGWAQAVLKPSIGASGHNVQLIGHGDDVAGALAGTGLAAAGREVMVQEFMPEISGGELAVVFFDGKSSHVFRRTPAEGEFRVNSQYQGVVGPTEAPEAVIAQARAVLDLLPEMPLYARVDGLVRDGRFIVMELELNEPGLRLQDAPGSGKMFAEATVRRLR